MPANRRLQRDDWLWPMGYVWSPYQSRVLKYCRVTYCPSRIWVLVAAPNYMDEHVNEGASTCLVANELELSLIHRMRYLAVLAC